MSLELCNPVLHNTQLHVTGSWYRAVTWGGEGGEGGQGRGGEEEVEEKEEVKYGAMAGHNATGLQITLLNSSLTGHTYFAC